eukprot:13041686-Ditylum_brightwellii.AAC.1
MKVVNKLQLGSSLPASLVTKCSMTPANSDKIFLNTCSIKRMGPKQSGSRPMYKLDRAQYGHITTIGLIHILMPRCVVTSKYGYHILAFRHV